MTRLFPFVTAKGSASNTDILALGAGVALFFGAIQTSRHWLLLRQSQIVIPVPQTSKNQSVPTDDHVHPAPNTSRPELNKQTPSFPTFLAGTVPKPTWPCRLIRNQLTNMKQFNATR